jgi:heptosyltransferase-2
MNVGIVLPNWIGDVVMATPTLRALKKFFGERAILTGIMRPYVAPMLAETPWLDEFLCYDPRSRDASLREWSLVKQLRQRRLDQIVLLSNSLRTGLIAWLSGARRRVGYARYGRGPLLTDKLRPPRKGRQLVPVSALDYYLELAYHIGCPTESRQVELPTTRADEQAANHVWDSRGLGRTGAVVAMNPGGAYGAAKHWPAEYFAELARQLVQRGDTSVLVLCGPSERDVAREVEHRAAHESVVSLADERPSLGLSKACVRRSNLLVTTDSGPRHFAAAFRVPAVTLFGPTDPRWSWNYHPEETVLQRDMACSPCAKRVCPYKHHRCMRDLTPDKVLTLVQERLNLLGCERAA